MSISAFNSLKVRNFQTKFCIFGRKISDKKKYLYGLNFGGGVVALPYPRPSCHGHDATEVKKKSSAE